MQERRDGDGDSGGDGGGDGDSRAEREWRAAELARRVGNRRKAVVAMTMMTSLGEGDTAERDEDGGRSDGGGTPVASRSPCRKPKRSVADRTSRRGGLVALPALDSVRREHYSIQMDVLDAQAQQRAAIHCADKHFIVEEDVRRLRSDLDAVQSTVRQKFDRVGDLQARVTRLSTALHDTSSEKFYAKTRILQMEEIRKKKVTIRECDQCGRSFLPQTLTTHIRRCRGSSDDMNNPRSKHSIKFVSQPPRHFRIATDGVSHNSLLLQWEPPIFTGSNPIIDFELRYSLCRETRSAVGTTRRYESLPPLLTSYWCQKMPIASNQFLLTGLTANKQYGEFTVAAITTNGTSQPSNPIDFVKLAPPIAPTEPLFFSVGVVTAKTINLSWTEPMDPGGEAIIDYEISFVEAVMEEVISSQTNYLNVSEVAYKNRLVRTSSTNLSYTISNLLSGKEHKQFQVRAVNAAGIPGRFSSTIPSIFTIVPGNEFKLVDELQAAVNAQSRVIDSQFLSGFMQRYDRLHYIDIVSRFIISLYPELEDKVASIVNRANGDTAVNTENNPATEVRLLPPRKRFEELSEDEVVMARRRQFHFRIAELEKELKRVDYNIQWCHDRQVDLVALIRAAESRILEKQAELERARAFRGPQMDSDVLEHGLQRFNTQDLILALEDEVEIEQLYIVDTKAEIVTVDNYLLADQMHRIKVAKQIEARRSALEKFEESPREIGVDKNEAAKLRGIALLRDDGIYQAFVTLAQHRSDCINARRKVRVALERAVTYKLRSAMVRWRATAKSLSHQVGNGSDVPGVGSYGLLNASIARNELANEARTLLGEIAATDAQLQSLAWTSGQADAIDQAKATTQTATAIEVADTKAEMESKYSAFWLEADAKMDLRNWEGAYQLYIFIHNHESWMQSMDVCRIVDLKLKIGKALYQMKDYEQALVVFNRASISAAQSGKKEAEGASYLHIAETTYELGSFQSCIDYFDRALFCFEATGDKKGELICYRGLEAAYSKLEDPEMVSTNKILADEIEFALQQTMNTASKKLQQFQKRLVGIGAESTKQIELERVGAVVPRLRRERITAKYRIREEQKLIDSLEALLAEKRELLRQGEQDLKRALASDSTQVDSSIISGSCSRYEIDNFKKKLAKLMGSVKAGEEYITKEIANAAIRISNAKDEIKEIESELAVETGALMRRMHAKEGLRCFRFSATNDALKNVVGSASQGITTCVATAGWTGFLFDLLSGACLSQALGDPHKDHLGEPTGHQAQIVSLYYVGNRIYTGSMDCCLGVWIVVDTSIGGFSCTLLKLLRVFDSAVVSIAADSMWMACGCSDCDVFLFDAAALSIIARVITAHEGTTTTIVLDSSSSSFVTGATDNRVKVWNVEPPPQATTTKTASVRRKVVLVCTLEAERRGDEYFNGHIHPLSCLRRSASEIVSADTGGRIILWNLDAERKLLRICDAHKVGVMCLQFDAMKIVSGGQDGNICVTDFATGHLIQTLVGHQTAVLDLQFDRKRLISMSKDGCVRLWYWQTRAGFGMDRKKYHILGAGETLKSLSLRYRTSIDNLLRWNHLPDSSKLYLGQKLVVEVDTTGVASDELSSLDTAVSVTFGKTSHENLDFLATNKTKSADTESQWAAQRLAQMAKEYFPPLSDEAENDSTSNDNDANYDSDDDLGRATDSEAEQPRTDADDSNSTK